MYAPLLTGPVLGQRACVPLALCDPEEGLEDRPATRIQFHRS